MIASRLDGIVKKRNIMGKELAKTSGLRSNDNFAHEKKRKLVCEP